MEPYYLIYAEDCVFCSLLRKRMNEKKNKVYLIDVRHLFTHHRMFDFFQADVSSNISVPVLYKKEDGKFIIQKVEKE